MSGNKNSIQLFVDIMALRSQVDIFSPGNIEIFFTACSKTLFRVNLYRINKPILSTIMIYVTFIVKPGTKKSYSSFNFNLHHRPIFDQVKKKTKFQEKPFKSGKISKFG